MVDTLLEQFASYGLSGIVIFALFGTLYLFFRQSNQERKEVREQHSQSQVAWREVHTACSKEVQENQKEITGAIKDLTLVMQENILITRHEQAPKRENVRSL